MTSFNCVFVTGYNYGSSQAVEVEVNGMILRELINVNTGKLQFFMSWDACDNLTLALVDNNFFHAMLP